MATLETQVQGLIDRLNTEQQTAAEAALIAAAINELSSYQTFQQALLAVAEGDLNTAVSNLELAKTQLDTSADTNVQSINAATALLSQELVKLDALPEIRSQVGNLDGKFRRKVRKEGYVVTSNNTGSHRRSKVVYAIYDSNGDTYALMPAYTTHTSSSNQQYLSYLYCLKPDKSHVQLGSWRIDSDTYQTTEKPTWLNVNTSIACAPLALKADASDIGYIMVYGEQDRASTNAQYNVIRVDNQPLINRVSLKHGVEVVDQYGFRTRVNKSGSNYAGHNRILYSNDKNCLLALRDDDQLVEIYRDDIVETGQTFPDDTSLQAFVDANDIIVLPFIHPATGNHTKNSMGADHSSYSGNTFIPDSFGKHSSTHFTFESGRLVPLSMSQNVKQIYGNNVSGDVQSRGALQSHFVLRNLKGGLIVDCEAELNTWGGNWNAAGNTDALVLAVNPFSGSVLGAMDVFRYDGSNYYYGLWKGTLS